MTPTLHRLLGLALLLLLPAWSHAQDTTAVGSLRAFYSAYLKALSTDDGTQSILDRHVSPDFLAEIRKADLPFDPLLPTQIVGESAETAASTLEITPDKAVKDVYNVCYYDDNLNGNACIQLTVRRIGAEHRIVGVYSSPIDFNNQCSVRGHCR